MRRDAGAAALQFGVRASDVMTAAAGPDTVWNVGSMVFKPGASNVVPNEAELVFQFRDTSVAGMDAIEDRIRQSAEDCAAACNAKVEITRTLDIRPTAMASQLIHILDQAASELGEKPDVLAQWRWPRCNGAGAVYSICDAVRSKYRWPQPRHS
jgi:metal-dependent amidase/aminoacylase/carboxypeptidase family protein